MDTWNYISYFTAIIGFITGINYLLHQLTEFNLIKFIKNTIRRKTYKEKIRDLLKNYQLHKHLAQTPQQRSGVVTLEALRVLIIILPVLVPMGYYTYLFARTLSVYFHKTPDLFFDISLSSLLTLIYAMRLTKIPFKRLSPAYHFKTFHELIVCQTYELLKKIGNLKNFSAEEIKTLRNLAQTCLENELPKNELTELGLAFHFITHNYPKAVKKKMKNKNYNFDADKEGLKQLLDLLPVKTPFSNSQYTVRNVHFQSDFKWPS